MATPWSFVQGPRPAWAPPPFQTPFAVPVPVPVPVDAKKFKGAKGPLQGQFPPSVFGPANPQLQQILAGQAFNQMPFSRAAPQSAPAASGPMLPPGALANAWNDAVRNRSGYGTGGGPQGPDEMRIAYGGRRAGATIRDLGVVGSAMTGNPSSIMDIFTGQVAPQLAAGARAVGNEVKGAFDYLTATPNSDLERAFQAMVQQESGGRQSAVSNKGAVGVAQVMPGTGPEAAKLAGLPWDPQRYKNDAAYNYALGFAYFKKQVADNGGDVFKGMAAYNAGPGRVQQAVQQSQKTGQPWAAFLPQETQNYIPSVLSKMGALAQTFGAPPPGFNAQPYQNAMAAQDQAAALLSKPFSAEMNYTPLPERPAPTELQAPDFSAGNAAFEQTRPKNPFDDPKEAVRIQRQQYFKGIGQAMASLSGGEGIGTMLMKMGAGALMGRARGQELVDAKEEQFQQQLADFNRALASRNDQQAVTSANILNQNIAQRNQYAEAIWQDNVQQINKFQPQVQGDKLITFQPDPTDPNKKTMTVTPLGYGIQAEAILNKANIGIQLGQAQTAASQFAYSSQQTAARTALGLGVQMAAQQGNGQASAEGYLTEAANRARATVRAGNWRDLFGNDTSNLSGQLDAHAKQMAYQALGVQLRPDGTPIMPLSGTQASQFQDLYEDNLTSNIYEAALKAGTVDKLFTMTTAHTAYTSQRGKNQRESQRTDSRGRTSYSTSWDMGE